MTIEDQVCTLEQSYRLVELVANQDSLWVWCESRQTAFSGVRIIRRHEAESAMQEPPAFQLKFMIAAYTCAELGVILGEQSVCVSPTLFGSHKGGHLWEVSPIDTDKITQFPTEAQARAALLIHLIETKRLTP